MTQAASSRTKGRTELSEVLDEAGIHVTDRRFLSLLREALRDVQRPTVAPPITQLTAAEVELLRAGGLDPSAGAKRYDSVRARTAARAAVLLSSSLSVKEVAERLKVDPSRVRQMLAESTLYGIKDGGEWRVPAFQFSGDRLVANLGPVIAQLPHEIHPLSVQNWMTGPQPDLAIEGHPVSPLEWLESGGDPAPVAALAADL